MNSYGYHGDDGHSFCSSGTGQPYGPTFTTGDVIGCGINLIDNTCFYTKNGHHLGIAFTDLPPNLYPTVGLQTPGEVVDANFGQSPFVFNIEDLMREMRARTRALYERIPVPDAQGEWQHTIQKMVSSYLIHHGYSATAESFTRHADQPFNQDMASMRKRQRILHLVLSGRIGEAVSSVDTEYPGLMDRNPDLLFRLKVRQFIEMVNGTDCKHSQCPSKTVNGESGSSGTCNGLGHNSLLNPNGATPCSPSPSGSCAGSCPPSPSSNHSPPSSASNQGGGVASSSSTHHQNYNQQQQPQHKNRHNPSNLKRGSSS